MPSTKLLACGVSGEIGGTAGLALVLAVKFWDARAARVKRATFETRINLNLSKRN
jgi:hypothetical protein